MARKIPLIVMTPEGDTNFQVLANVLKEPANGRGATYDEMKRTVPLIERFEEHAKSKSEFVILEDAEWKLTRERLQASPFMKNSRPVLDMIEAFSNAEHFSIREVPKEPAA